MIESRREQAVARARLPRQLRAAALVLVLLAAEAFAVVHPIDLDLHANDEPCKICISVAGLGAAAVAEAGSPTFDAGAAPLGAVPAHSAGRTIACAYLARGPPSLLS